MTKFQICQVCKKRKSSKTVRRSFIKPEELITIFRPVYTQQDFDNKHHCKEEDKSVKECFIHYLKAFKNEYCEKLGIKQFIFRRFPFIKTLMKYNLKKNLYFDFMSGLMVSMLQIPQSLSYAQAVGIQPIYGLYLALFPVMVYFCMGTSKHLSIGTVSIVSLMSARFLQKALINNPLPLNSDNWNVSVDASNEVTKALMLSGFTLCIGISQLIIGVFCLGFLTKYFSYPLMSGFAAATATTVLITQLKFCLGIDIHQNIQLFNAVNKFQICQVCKKRKSSKTVRRSFIKPEELITIFRPVYTQQDFDNKHHCKEEDKSVKECFIHYLKAFKNEYCEILGIKQFIFRRFPFIKTLMKYNLKKNFYFDFMSGLMVSMLQIPQSLSYAQAVGIQPIYGLYLALFPVIVYFCMGTSKHLSIGTVSIVSLMSARFLQKALINNPLPLNSDNWNVSVDASNEVTKALMLSGFTLCIGISQLIIGVFCLGFLTKYFSYPLMSGFAAATATTVLITQLKFCLGIDIRQNIQLFNAVNTLISLSQNLSKVNFYTCGMSVVSLIILLVTNAVINPRILKKYPIQIPIESIILIFGIVTSNYLDLENKYNITIVGPYKQGLPSPVIPNIINLSNNILDIIVTAVMSFMLPFSAAQLICKKHGYKLDVSQEFVAYGVMNIVSSCFYCYPSGAFVSRSLAQEQVKGKTQIASFISAILVLFLLLFIGSAFEKVPRCILGSVVIAQLLTGFFSYQDIKELWLFSIWDFSIWMVTFLFTFYIDVSYGIVSGILISFLSILFRTHNPNSFLLGQIIGTEIYKNLVIYQNCNEIPGIKIFRYEGNIYFASKSNFKNSLYSKVGRHPIEIKFLILKLQNQIKILNKKLKVFHNEEILEKKHLLQNELDTLIKPHIHHIIVDCSIWNYVDIDGVKVLHQLIQEFKEIKVTVLFACVKSELKQMFNRIEPKELIDEEAIFVTIHDAVISILNEYEIITKI